MLPVSADYQSLYKQFIWNLPERFNIGEAISGRWAREQPERTAIIFNHGDDGFKKMSFGQLDQLANKIAQLLFLKGVRRGDRVAVMLPQMPETAAVHIAIYKMAAIAVPVAMLFGSDGLRYRLEDSGASVVVLSSVSLEKLGSVRDDLSELKHVVSIDGGKNCIDLYSEIESFDGVFDSADTGLNDPALMIYTSGTTGSPKGALHGHRVLLGHLPGVQFAHEFFPQKNDMMWTPADWAWAGGLLNVLLPSLYFGVPVVARTFEKFTAEKAWELLAQVPIANVFLPPTALKIMRASSQHSQKESQKEKLSLRTIFSGGEAVGEQLQRWVKAELGLHINEVYGQTECNLVLESCGQLGVLKNGAIGKPVPGSQVAIVDETGNRVQAGAPGNIAIKRPHPVMFLEYWNNDQATADKFIGDWLITGDQGFEDDEGYFHFVGRDDDIITSSGYRIGPGEIEDCLIGHEAVQMSAVVGKPDELRTEIVVAFIVLAEGYVESQALTDEIQFHVRTQLSAHEYPREIIFREILPMTTTGKIIRRLLRDEFHRA